MGEKITEMKCYGSDIAQEIDLTDYVNSIVMGTTQNNGFYLHFNKPLNFFDLDSQRGRQEKVDCDTLLQWELNGSYEPAEIVAVNKAAFSANEYPNNLFGGMAGYAPGTATGEIAWTKVDDCLVREMKIFSSEFENIDMRPELEIDDGVVAEVNTIATLNTKFKYSVSNKQLKLVYSTNKINRVRIFSLKGKLVKSIDVDNGIDRDLIIPLDDLSEGFYMCKVFGANSIGLFRIINR